MIRKLLPIIASIGIAALLLYLVFRNVEWLVFWQRAKSVNYFWVIVSILLSFVAYVARAYRWNILLSPFGYKLKTSRTTLAVLVGYLANLALPRLGEITRCGVLNRNDGVSVPVAFGTVIVDRIVDVVTLLIIFMMSLLIESDRLIKFFTSAYQDLHVPNWIWIMLSVAAISLFLGFIYLIKNGKRFNEKFSKIIKDFVAGIVSMKDIKDPIGFIISTIVIWVVYFLMSYVIVFSLPETSHLGLSAGLMLLITGGVALSLPVQSGFGTYHGMIAGMLLLYSIEHTTGIFLATLMHTSQIIAIAFFGTFALVISFWIRKKKSSSDPDKSM